MTNARLITEEAQGFLDANPTVQWIDAFVFDMSGISRGKRIRRPDSARRRQERDHDANLGFYHVPARQLRGGDGPPVGDRRSGPPVARARSCSNPDGSRSKKRDVNSLQFNGYHGYEPLT